MASPGSAVEMQGGAEREDWCGGQGSDVHGRRRGQLPGLMGGGQSGTEPSGRRGGVAGSLCRLVEFCVRSQGSTSVAW